MVMIPVRNLAQGGIILDQHPTALPLPAFTNGRNVLFDDGKCSRAPVWRQVKASLGSSPVRHMVARTPANSFDEVIVARDDGSLARVHDGQLTEASQVGFAAQNYNSSPWSSGVLGDVVYVNRGDMAPRSLKPNQTQFEVLPHWPSGWTCGVLRTFRDTLVALNVTKTSSEYPSTVDVSDVAYYQTVPGSWDSTDPTTLAYESPLARLTGPILDGCALGDRFFIFTQDQVVEMTADQNFLYSFTDLPFKDGIISANCSCQIDGLVYVFGARDIWTTDGQSKQSLAENRVKDALYSRLDYSAKDKFHVAFDPVRNCIFFCFVSSNPEAAWSKPTGCNEAFVYCRTSNTWSIVDLPNVSSMAVADVNTATAWQNLQVSWADFGGSWYDLGDGRNRQLMAVSAPLPAALTNYSTITDNRLIAYDAIDRGSRLALPIVSECNAPSFVDRVGISLDAQQSGGVPLITTKLIRGLVPEIWVSRPEGVVTVYATATATPFGTVQWPNQGIQFRPNDDYHLDCMAEGRYLALRAVFPSDCDCEFSGVDIDAVTNGRR